MEVPRGRAPPHAPNGPPQEVARARPRFVHMVPIVNGEAAANNTLATMGDDKGEGASKRSTQYLGPYGGRHDQAVGIW